MIFDSIHNAQRYETISTNLKIALEYMRENDLAAMDPGRYSLAEGKVLVIIKKGYLTKEQDQAKWESHLQNIDIQYMLEGREQIGVAPAEQLQPRTEYDQESDKILYTHEDQGFMTCLDKGDFLILFPGEAHATCLNAGGLHTCNKAVIKVALE